MVTQETLNFFFSLLHRESGLTLDESKSYLIETRLEPIADKEGFPSIDDLCRHMRKNPSSNLCQKVVDAMMTTETSFFRDITPFEVLKDVILPNLINTNDKTRKIRIWSAGCSSGQEPYSIAMIICEMASKLRLWDIEILATDIAEGALERARAGVYSQYETQRGLSATHLTRFFSQQGSKWEIRPEVKRFVKFKKLNFLSGFSIIGDFDIIFCRNVLIYFDVNTKTKILERFTNILSPGGVLLLGGTETPFGITDEFIRVEAEKGVYYKKNLNSSKA